MERKKFVATAVLLDRPCKSEYSMDFFFDLSLWLQNEMNLTKTVILEIKRVDS